MSGSDSSTIAVIPARYGSRRLPGKPLLSETGKPLIQHVYERVQQAHTIGRVLVATDDERIAEAVRGFGGNVVMTSPDHPSGTDRVAEAVAGLDVERVVNVQGDEPDINPGILDTLVAQLDHAEMATLAVKFPDPEDASSPHRVKVLVGDDGFASTFTRAPLNGESLLHLGVYAYTRDCLLRFTALPPSPLEKKERLEQLRAIENGIRIRVAVVDWRSPGGIDTREDYDNFLKRERGE